MRGDPTFSAPTLYQASTSYFAQSVGATGTQRWGTYSSAVADPNNPNGFWISNEYVTNTGVTIPSGLSAWWDTAVAQVEVAPYAPVLGGAGTSATYTEGGAATPLDSALTVQDVSSTALAGATIAIGGGLLAGDALNFSNQDGIVGNFNATTGVLTLSGTASLAAYQAALEIDHLFIERRRREQRRRGPVPYDYLDGDGRRADLDADHEQRGYRRRLERDHFILGHFRSYQLSATERLAVGPAVRRHRRDFALRGDQPQRRRGDDGVALYAVQLRSGRRSTIRLTTPESLTIVRPGRFVLTANNLQPDGSTNIDIAVSNDSNPTDGWSVASLDTSTGRHDAVGYAVSVGQWIGSDGNIYFTAPEYATPGLHRHGPMGYQRKQRRQRIAADRGEPDRSAVRRHYAQCLRRQRLHLLRQRLLERFADGAYLRDVQRRRPASATPQTLALGNNDQGPGGTDYTAQQAGTSLTLDAGDSRIQSLAYSNGYLYGVSETMPIGASAPDVHWFKLDVSNPASPQIRRSGRSFRFPARQRQYRALQPFDRG